MRRSAILLAATSAALLCTPRPASADGPMPDMSGLWAQKQVTTSVSKVPVIGEIVTTTTSLLLLKVEQSGDEVELREQICDIDVTSTSKRMTTTIPRAFQRAASGATRKARIWQEGDTVRFEQEPRVVVLGARLAHPTRDALPEDADDARVIDADRDGKPGLTVKLNGIIDGEVYIVQRGWNRLRGTFSGQDRIDGHITWSSTQTVIDATSVFLNSSPKSRPHRNKSKSHFKSRRVSAGTSCATLRRQARAMF